MFSVPVHGRDMEHVSSILPGYPKDIFAEKNAVYSSVVRNPATVTFFAAMLLIA